MEVHFNLRLRWPDPDVGKGFSHSVKECVDYNDAIAHANALLKERETAVFCRIIIPQVQQIDVMRRGKS